MRPALESAVLAVLAKLRYLLTRPLVPVGVPDRELYQPRFLPWLGGGDFERLYRLAEPRTLVARDRCYVLQTLLRQALHVLGNIWECGVYRGGTAAMFAAMLNEAASDKRLFLFDTFGGMPETNPDKDLHRQGDFADTSLDAVRAYVGQPERCVFRQGWIPETFRGLETERIAFAHIDVDIHQSVLDCLSFIWPRLSPGGFIVLDDYGFYSCPGARAAVDEFFAKRPAVPLCLATGQAVVFKSTAEAA